MESLFICSDFVEPVLLLPARSEGVKRKELNYVKRLKIKIKDQDQVFSSSFQRNRLKEASPRKSPSRGAKGLLFW